MSENCTHDCDKCKEDCASRKTKRGDMFVAPNGKSRVKKVIGVVSGKGGVGKSMVTSLLAVEMNRRAYTAAILDADVTGPSIPKLFGVREKAFGDENGLYPAVTKSGIKVMSVNLLLDDETEPVIWRGPVISGAVQQFWTEVIWENVDFMFVDMPPGTGDVALTVFQSLPLDGIVVVTSPQELVSMIVAKAVKMAKKMDVPVLGIVENYSYLLCPDCGKRISVFGESKADTAAAEFGLKVLDRLPIDPKLAAAADAGLMEACKEGYVKMTGNALEELWEKDLRDRK